MSNAVSRSISDVRPTSVTAAAAAMAVLSIGNIALSIVEWGNDDIPAVTNYIGIILGVVGLAAVWGLLQCRKWAMITSIGLAILTFVTSAPGIPFGPDALAIVSSIFGVVLSVAIVALLLRQSARASFNGRASTSV